MRYSIIHRQTLCTSKLNRPKDIGMVYVSLIGDGVCEAVTVTLAEENGDTRIRYLEWGRP